MGALRGAMRGADFATNAFHAHTALKTLELSGNGFTEAAIDPAYAHAVWAAPKAQPAVRNL